MVFPQAQTGSGPGEGTSAITMKTSRKAGMTLVEVVVAVLILGFTLGGGIRALTVHRRVAEAASRQAEAYHKARAVLEDLTERSFYHADVADGIHSLAGGGRYVVTRVSATNLSLKRLVVSVPWSGGDPGTDGTPSETLTTVICEALHP